MQRQTLSPFAPVVLRLGLGAIFLFTGLTKAFGLAGVGHFFARIGIPLPSVAALLITILEVIGSLSILLGLGLATRVAAVLLAIEMLVVVIILPGTANPVWHGLELALMVGLLSLALSGPGRFALLKEGTPSHAADQSLGGTPQAQFQRR